MRSHDFRVTRLPLFLVFILLTILPANAQYFGRNKVQWENFNFKVLKTEHFDIYYYSQQKEVIDDTARMAERWYQRLSSAFDHTLSERKPIILYSDHADFQQTTSTSGLIGEGTGGFTDPFKNRVVMPLTGSYAETDHVLGHELVHVFQFDLERATRGGRGGVQLGRLPLFMIEGLAEYFSQGHEDPNTAMWIRDAAIHDKLPDERKLSRDSRFSPYHYGQAFWAYLAGRYGDREATRFFVAAGSAGLDQAFRKVLGTTSKEFFAAWHAALRANYDPVIAARQNAASLGTPVLSKKTTRSDLNIAPAVSPDGKWVAFLSTRDLFSIDLFLADARTGQVIKRLVSSATNPHFDALRFVDSAGSWSPDGSRFAFVIFERGDNRIGILNVSNLDIERRIEIRGIGSITNPAWSPDGRSLVFSGSSGGVNDLYLLDIASGESRQLTNDRYADLQPAWSPDGNTIAFVSDRGNRTDFQNLTYDPLSLALYDLASGEVRAFEIFGDAKHINPQFSPDGQTLYFVSNPEGVADIYSYGVRSGAIAKITNVATGVSGITEFSPTISVSQTTGRLMYSLFNQADFVIYGLEGEALRGAPVITRTATIGPAGILPPAQMADRGVVEKYLDRPREGLISDDSTFPTREYSPKLTLDYVGPPTIGIGADRYGLGVGGSLSLYFSDVLGEQQVGVTLQGGGSSGSSLGSQLGGQAIYVNRENRINWGGSLTHVPFTSVSTGIGEADIVLDGVPVTADVVRQLRVTTTVDELSLLSYYPFSITRRFELNTGYTRYGFDREIEDFFFVEGREVGSEFTELDAPQALDFYRGAAAYVGDNSFFGFVSPIRGVRYRFEAEALMGDLSFTTALADYRRYVFMRPLTLAFRGLHYGRYGSDAEDERISPLNVGRDTLVRGYDSYTFSASECTAPEGSDVCPEFERLIGSKIGVANIELRAPLFGTEDFGFFNVPFLPTELLAFFDAGVAWTENEDPELKFERETVERVPVFSAGIGARILLGGYLPLEFYLAKPFQRPQEDTVFGFTIAPGW